MSSLRLVSWDVAVEHATADDGFNSTLRSLPVRLVQPLFRLLVPAGYPVRKTLPNPAEGQYPRACRIARSLRRPTGPWWRPIAPTSRQVRWPRPWGLNGGEVSVAQRIAAHESPRTTGLYDRTSAELSLDEIERIRI